MAVALQSGSRCQKRPAAPDESEASELEDTQTPTTGQADGTPAKRKRKRRKKKKNKQMKEAME